MNLNLQGLSKLKKIIKTIFHLFLLKHKTKTLKIVAIDTMI